MQKDVQTEKESVEQVVSVEPVDEGPRMRIKKPLTEAQLAALRKGREKLAEKRKAAGTTEEGETLVKKDDPVDNTTDSVKNDVVDDINEDVSDSDDYHFTYCSIM